MIGTVCIALLALGSGALTILHERDQRCLKRRVQDLHRRVTEIEALTPARKHSDATIEEVRSLWVAGLSSAVIGKRLGLSADAIRGIARRAGFPVRPSPIRRAA